MTHNPHALTYIYTVKWKNFRVVQFSRKFAVGRDPRNLKSAKYISKFVESKSNNPQAFKDTVLQWLFSLHKSDKNTSVTRLMLSC